MAGDLRPPARSPIVPSRRIVALDGTRGLAVIGIALVNVFTFAMPPAAYYNPRAFGGEGPIETALWAAGFLVIEDKARALFAMLFGAGIAVLLERERESPLRRLHLRMLVLFAIGYVHATLLASNDILRLYALIGLVLPLVARLRPRALLALSGLLIALHLAVFGWIGWGWVDYWWRLRTIPGTDPAQMNFAEAVFGADPKTIAFQLERGRETLGARVVRLTADPIGPLVAGLAFLPTTLAAALVGMAFWKNGLFRGRWTLRALTRLGIVTAVVSLPPLAALAGFAVWTGFNPAIVATNALVWSTPFDFLLSIGWAALAMGLFQRIGPANPVVGRLAAAGRMSLTNYVGTSVVFGAIFASWGLGLFGEFGRTACYGLALIPIVLMLGLSPLWLARFRQGPLEWLWRGTASGSFTPLRI